MTTDKNNITDTAAPRWNLDSIFPGGSGSAEYRDFRKKTRNDLDHARDTVNRLPATLDDDSVSNWKDFILELQRLGLHISLASSFVHCLISQKVDDDEANTIYGEVDVMIADWYNLRNSLEAFSVKQSDAVWEKFVSLPLLTPIRFYLDELRRNAREKMPPELESLVLDLSVNGYHAWSRLYDKISGRIKVEFQDGDKLETLSVGQLQNKFLNPDRGIRKRAFTKFQEAWQEEASLTAAALNYQGGFRLSIYKHRDWDSVLHEPLRMGRMKEETLTAMWQAVTKALPQVTRYIEAKKKVLGITEFCWYDQFAPVGKLDMTMTFDKAGEFIIEHLGSFSQEMAVFSQMALAKNWVEGEDRPGKADGGYCTGMNLIGQSRIFMTYGNDFGSMTTLAHELGHAYHQWVLKDIPYLATEYPMGLAETASIFNELRVTDAALQGVTDPQQKLMLLDQILQQPFILFCNIYARYLFDGWFYDERARGVVSRARLDELMIKAQKEAFGEILDPTDGYHPLFWASKLHFYYTEAPFYNFPYTFGFLFAGGVYARASREGKEFAPKYRALLQDTGRMATEEVATKHLNLDLTDSAFWDEAVARSVAYVDEFVKLADELS
ncbi:MAG: M3 family oligoendopeptidase [candidate division Zixibacteria bacterium]|nr:M3 family oligoendopeptidase [candidate division Zixibacteria bacterium]